MEVLACLVNHGGVFLALLVSSDEVGCLLFRRGPIVACSYEASDESSIAGMSSAVAFVYFFEDTPHLIRS